MITVSNSHSASQRLAARIESDIRARGLRSGDRYLTAAQVAKAMGVSTMSANRAMQILAARHWLARGRRTGTRVGGKFPPLAAVAPACLHLLVSHDHFQDSSPLFEQIMLGLHDVLPDAPLQLSFVPGQHDVAFVRRLVESSVAAGGFGGAVLFGSSLQVQRYFVDNGLPAVAAGSVFPEAKGLPWVERDQHSIGRALASRVLRQRHRRIALLMRDRWAYGDSLMVDGVQQALAERKSGCPTLTIRSVPTDPEILRSTVADLLQSPQPPTAWICRSLAAAETVAAAVPRRRGEPAPCIVVADFYGGRQCRPQFPCTCRKIDGRTHGQLIGHMLRQTLHGQRPEPDHRLIEIELIENAKTR